MTTWPEIRKSFSEKDLDDLFELVVRTGSYYEARAAIGKGLEKTDPHYLKAHQIRRLCEVDFPERFAAVRERFEAEVEENAIRNAMAVHQVATRATMAAAERAGERLEDGTYQGDPAQAARNLSQVATQMLQGSLTLQGRPTKITAADQQGYDQLVRALAAEGIEVHRRQLPVPDAEVVEDEAD